jgi:hypothetical protein
MEIDRGDYIFREILSPFHFIHHKSHRDCSEIEFWFPPELCCFFLQLCITWKPISYSYYAFEKNRRRRIGDYDEVLVIWLCLLDLWQM